MKSFSQTGTTRTDTTVVILPNYIAKQVIKDLLEGDRAKSRGKLLQELNKEFEAKIANQRSLLSIASSKEIELNRIIQNKDRQLEYQKIISSEFKDKHKRQVRKTRFFKLTSGVAVAGAIVGVLLIQR